MSDLSSSSPAPVSSTAAPKSRDDRQQQTAKRDPHASPQTDELSPGQTVTNAPAVSVAASIVGLHAGDRLSGPIIGIDGDGHPVFETPKGRFAINPTAGLEAHIFAEILVTQSDPHIEGQLIARNDVKTEPPVDVVLTLVTTRGNTPPPHDTSSQKETPLSASYKRTYPSNTAHAAPSTPDNTSVIETFLKKADFTFPANQSSLTAPAPAPAPAPAQQPTPGLKTNNVILDIVSTIILNEQAALAQIEEHPIVISGFALGEVLHAQILPPGDARENPGNLNPLSPFEAAFQGKTGLEIQIAVVAVNAPDVLSPIATPAPGTPLAILADHGRLATFLVETFHDQEKLATLRHSGLRIALSVDQSPKPGTKVTVLLLGERGDLSQPRLLFEGLTSLPTFAPPSLHPQSAPQPWPVGDAILAYLGGLDPAASQTTRLPDFGPRLTNTALFLWRALNIGSAQAWLGSETQNELTTKGNARLWAALQRDISLFSDAQKTGGTEWRPWPLPVQGDGGFQLLTWFVRPITPHDQNDSPSSQDPNQDEGGQEFVVDVRFDGFGRLRFHGEVRQKQINLTIASANILPDGLKISTGQIFRNALEQQDFTGILRFHPGLKESALPQHIL